MRTLLRPIPLLLLTARILLCAHVQIRTEELPWAIAGAGYHQMIAAAVDPRCPGSDSVLSVTGKLPRGLELEGEYLTGTAREIGTFRFRIRIANDCAATERGFVLVVTGKPILRAYPESLTFHMRTGRDLPPTQSVSVSATWPELPYQVTSDAGWMVTKPRSGITPPEGSGLLSDTVKVQVGAAGLAPGVYRTTLHVSTWNGANSPEVAVTLIVLP